jgi:hypothetical protein
MLKSLSCFTDGGRPPGAAGQTEAPNHLKGLQSRAGVPSFREKAAAKRSGMIRRGEEHEPHMRRRDEYNHSQKRDTVPVPLQVQAQTAGGLCGCRRRCGTTSEPGCKAEHGNQSLRCKGRASSSRPARGRVPKRRTGADQLVVAIKRLNRRGAKELKRSAEGTGQPTRGGAYD